jgi:hypothetical protein
MEDKQTETGADTHTHTHTGEGYLARLSRCVGCCVCVCVCSLALASLVRGCVTTGDACEAVPVLLAELQTGTGAAGVRLWACVELSLRLRLKQLITTIHFYIHIIA